MAAAARITFVVDAAADKLTGAERVALVVAAPATTAAAAAAAPAAAAAAAAVEDTEPRLDGAGARGGAAGDDTSHDAPCDDDDHADAEPDEYGLLAVDEVTLVADAGSDDAGRHAMSLVEARMSFGRISPLPPDGWLCCDGGSRARRGERGGSAGPAVRGDLGGSAATLRPLCGGLVSCDAETLEPAAGSEASEPRCKAGVLTLALVVAKLALVLTPCDA
jgi:hypothetical protein